MKIYNYHPESGDFLGEKNAPLNPLETAKQGESVYLTPAYATQIEPPENLDPRKKLRWDGSAWQIVSQEFIQLSSDKKFFEGELRQAIEGAFPGIELACDTDFDSVETKELNFESIEDTDANRAVLQAIIDAHDYSTIETQKESDAKDIGQTGKLLRAAFLVLAAQTGMTETEFRNAVIAKYDSL